MVLLTASLPAFCRSTESQCRVRSGDGAPQQGDARQLVDLASLFYPGNSSQIACKYRECFVQLFPFYMLSYLYFGLQHCTTSIVAWPRTEPIREWEDGHSILSRRTVFEILVHLIKRFTSPEIYRQVSEIIENLIMQVVVEGLWLGPTLISGHHGRSNRCIVGVRIVVCWRQRVYAALKNDVVDAILFRKWRKDQTHAPDEGGFPMWLR